MSDQAANLITTPAKDENQNKETPVSLKVIKFNKKLKRRYREKIIWVSLEAFL